MWLDDFSFKSQERRKSFCKYNIFLLSILTFLFQHWSSFFWMQVHFFHLWASTWYLFMEKLLTWIYRLLLYTHWYPLKIISPWKKFIKSVWIGKTPSIFLPRYITYELLMTLYFFTNCDFTSLRHYVCSRSYFLSKVSCSGFRFKSILKSYYLSMKCIKCYRKKSSCYCRIS